MHLRRPLKWPRLPTRAPATGPTLGFDPSWCRETNGKEACVKFALYNLYRYISAPTHCANIFTVAQCLCRPASPTASLTRLLSMLPLPHR